MSNDVYFQIGLLTVLGLTTKNAILIVQFAKGFREGGMGLFEATLEAANDLARTATGIDVDHTGSAGLAGLLQLARSGELRPDENVVICFSGITRHPAQEDTRS